MKHIQHHEESMYQKKIECKNGWIVFIVHQHKVIEVHSTGLVTSGQNDRATNNDLIRILEHTAMNNQLHSQQPGRCGVCWPEEAE